MGYYFGKGATAPTDQFAASPQAPGTPDNQGECMQKCNDRYQKDLDNPSVDYATAQQRYNDCKMSCQDVPAIQEQAVSAYESTTLSAASAGAGNCYEDCRKIYDQDIERGMPYNSAKRKYDRCKHKCDSPLPPTPPPEVEGCEGGWKQKTTNGVPEGCPEGFKAHDIGGDAWCCPSEEPEPEPVVPGEGCEGGHILDDRFNDGKGKGLRPLTEKERAPYIPEGWFRSADWQGHIIWHPDYGYRDLKATHDYYESGSSDWTDVVQGACEKGMERRTIGSEEWCCPAAGGGGGGGGGLGEYQWPAELQELYSLLMGRGKEFMGMETGYTDEAIRAMFGRDFENIRDVGARTAETGLSALQREGLMGTGASQDLASEAAWGTEKGISDLMRDLFVSSEEKKKQDLLDYTGAAQGIFGGGMGYNSLLEQINAGRRGEGRESLAMMLQYLMSLMSSWGA